MVLGITPWRSAEGAFASWRLNLDRLTQLGLPERLWLAASGEVTRVTPSFSQLPPQTTCPMRGGKARAPPRKGLRYGRAGVEWRARINGLGPQKSQNRSDHSRRGEANRDQPW